jgi:hypothetical protein
VQYNIKKNPRLIVSFMLPGNPVKKIIPRVNGVLKKCAGIDTETIFL